MFNTDQEVNTIPTDDSIDDDSSSAALKKLASSPNEGNQYLKVII